MRKALAKILQVLSWIVYLVIALALLIAAPLIIGCHPVVVLSGSMTPAYPVGSIIYYKEASFENIAVGDAITFTIGDNSLATHRVIQKNETDQTFVTQGDNNPTQDTDPIAYDRVVGKASSFAIPFAGYFTSFLQHWYIIVLLGVILLLNMLLTPSDEEETASKKQKQGSFADMFGDSALAGTSTGLTASGAATASHTSKNASKSDKDVSAQEFFKDF